MKIISFIILPCLFLSLVNCRLIIGEDDKLHLKWQDYDGSELRVDGYYYTESRNSQGKIYPRYFFYRDGVIRYVGATTDLGVANWGNGNYKNVWGVFVIEGDNIQFEQWVSNSLGALLTYTSSGKIIDDETFVITETFRIVDGKKTNIKIVNEVYHFKSFTPKPTNVNSYIHRYNFSR